MSHNNTSLTTLGILTAVASSLCCITPLLAIFAGMSGFATTFSFLEPARPFFIGFTVAVLGFAWYQHLKPVNNVVTDCDCEEDRKLSFWQSRPFLTAVTVFALLMLALPDYAHFFYAGNNKTEVAIFQEANIETVKLGVSGMTCTGCEEHVKHAVNQLQGIMQAEASYEAAIATVKFDKTKTNLEAIKSAIASTGYEVVEPKILTNE